LGNLCPFEKKLDFFWKIQNFPMISPSTGHFLGNGHNLCVVYVHKKSLQKSTPPKPSKIKPIITVQDKESHVFLGVVKLFSLKSK